MSDPDPEKSKRVMQAMMQMGKRTSFPRSVKR